MKNLVSAAAAMCLAFSSCVAFAQTRPQGVLGLLGPDGSFHPFASSATTTTTTATKVSGTLKLTLTVTVVSSLLTGAPFLCGLQAVVSGASTTGAIDTIVDSDSISVKPAGTTATCQITLPYEWTLQGKTDSVSLSYSITATNANGGERLSNASFATISVPKNGATTTFSVATRI